MALVGGKIQIRTIYHLRNKHTYEDVTTLIEYMRKFDFIVEE